MFEYIYTSRLYCFSSSPRSPSDNGRFIGSCNPQWGPWIDKKTQGPGLLGFQILPGSLHICTPCAQSISMRWGKQMHVNSIMVFNAVSEHQYCLTLLIPRLLKLHHEYDRVFISRRNGPMFYDIHKKGNIRLDNQIEIGQNCTSASSINSVK